MESVNTVREALKEVYTEKRYYSISIVASFLIYSLNALAHNYKLVFSSFSLKLVSSLIVGFHYTMASYSIVFLVMLSILTGILISMTVFLIKRQIRSGVYASGTGVIASILAPACSSCALGIVGLLGLSGILTVLPLKGAEIGILGIIVVIFALVSISKKVVTKTCTLR
jgi:hypothetical protein